MQYGSVPGIDKPVSRLVQGTEMFKTWEPEVSLCLLDSVFDQGCTAFDTAHAYGDGVCERVLGRWLKERGVRDRVVIITKGAHHNDDRKRVTPFDIESDLYDSLTRLGVDSVDLYLLHRDDPSVAVGPIIEVLNKHLNAGHMGAIGASNWSHQRVQDANRYAKSNGLVPFVAASPHFSLAEQVEPPWADCVSITGPGQAVARQWYEASGMPLFTWATLSLGFLSGRVGRKDASADPSALWPRSFGTEANYLRLERAATLGKRKGLSVPQIAVAYVMSQPLNVFPIIASANSEEFVANHDAIELRLSSEEAAWLDLERDGLD